MRENKESLGLAHAPRNDGPGAGAGALGGVRRRALRRAAAHGRQGGRARLPSSVGQVSGCPGREWTTPASAVSHM